MIHLLPFTVGVLAGAAAVKILKKTSLSKGIDKAREGLRGAAVGGLSAVEHSASKLKEKLEHTPDGAAGEEQK